MQEKRYWQWKLATPRATESGAVWAVDPRDALSRALCSELPSGELVGSQYGVPVDFLRDVPANDDTTYEVAIGEMSLSVAVVTAPVVAV